MHATAPCCPRRLSSRDISVQHRTVCPKIPSSITQTYPLQYLSRPTSAKHLPKELENHTNKTQLHLDQTAQSAAPSPLQSRPDLPPATLNRPETHRVIPATPLTRPSQPALALEYVLPPRRWPVPRLRSRRNEGWPPRGLQRPMAIEPPSKKRSRQNVCLLPQAPSKPHLPR